MKLIRKMSSILVMIVFVFFSISGCNSSSNNLSRDNAKSLIQEAAKLDPVSITLTLGNPTNLGCQFKRVQGDLDERQFADAILLDWQEKGLITLVKHPLYAWSYCLLTDKGKASSKTSAGSEEADIYIGEHVIHDVTGIKMDESVSNAIVYFTYGVERNSAGNSLPPKIVSFNGNVILSTDIYEGSANLALYDDGWRVEKIKFGSVISTSSSSKDSHSKPTKIKAASTLATDRRGITSVAGTELSENKHLIKAWTMAELMAKGETVYNTNCVACHQVNGQGIPGVFKPIAGSPIATGDVAAHVDIVLHGKAGTAMPAFGRQLNAVDLAAVITYERNGFGNNAGDMVQPADIAAAK